MQIISLRPAVLLSLLLTAACSTVEPNAIARGAPCDHLGQIAEAEHNALLVCNEAAAGSAASTDATKGIRGGVWGIAGIDKPITAKGADNTKCSNAGELARAEDGSILLCAWNKLDLNNAAGVGHAD